MHGALLILLLAASLALHAEACCKVAGIGRCCGHGRCNIFCCNCDDGCKPKEKCSLSFAKVLDQIKGGTCKHLGYDDHALVRLVDNSDKDISRFALDACKEALGMAPIVKRDVSNVLEAEGRVRRAAQETFSLVDANRDGLISLGEASDHLQRSGRSVRSVDQGTVPKWFSEMDANGDGMIGPNEFDRRL